ncbi:enterobactin synthase subunit EntD [Citrobacter amalonaticus]|uniref:enterobactin synthase subunit EntD n=1 Tax=Citrobacter amalonaticus TaxID=35703 RepID=UPI001A1EDC14|nr:enterobactin synthase subunit EntD [Citrobacter amalonaticus]HDQ2811665.1 enterobactin synthase subunit EntD [Citrobacter amalonaticus]
MQTTHFPLILAHHTLHCVTFEPDTFHEHDLLWLPHHAQLARAGRKRKAEHLAGRIAAVHALREWGHKNVPGIGEQRQPLWPHGLFGSISHGATSALAVVSRQPVGVDIETIFTPQTAAELASSIVTETEKVRLAGRGLRFEQALTLAFSAKESAFKATPERSQAGCGFMHYHILDVQHNQIRLQAFDQIWRVQWLVKDSHVITVATG